MLSSAGRACSGLLVDQVQGDTRLHVDQRDVVRQHVVQLLRKEQPLVADATSLVVLCSTLPFGELSAANPHQFGDCQQHRQPAGDEREVGDALVVGGRRIDQAGNHVAHESEPSEHCRRLAVPLLDRSK